MDVGDAGRAIESPSPLRSLRPQQGQTGRGRRCRRPHDTRRRGRYGRGAAGTVMGDKPRILITGFRPFPGAPYNPTEKLVERLMRLRRPAFDNIERISHVFPVTYGAVDRELPALIENHHPHALLMFGLASRTPHMRIETRARNTVTQIWPDADHTRVQGRAIVSGGNDATRRFGPHTTRLLRVAEHTGLAVKSSLRAG